MAKVPNLVLTGFMGTGKSEVGRRVAQQLQRAFVDMDALIEAREGRSIPEIFAQEGEAYFRQREAEVIRELAEQEGLVIATGGGALIPEENRRRMAENGVIICLWADEETLIRRLAGDTHRPLLNRPDWRRTLRELLARRRNAYAQLPHHVDTTDKTPDQVATEVIRVYRESVAGRVTIEE